MRKLRLKKKYLVLLIVLVSIVFFFIVMGVSYAFFSSRVTSKDYVITTGNLQLNFLKANNEINLTNTYPLSNADGLATEGYSFDITNNGSISTKYQLRLELDPNNTIPIEYIRLSYVKTKENGVNTNNSLSESVLLSDLNAVYSFVKDDVIEPSKTDSYTLKLWIDFSAPNDIQGKTFKAKIAIDSLQNVEDGYVFNSTRPIITLNKFSDGNTDQVIPLNSQFVDPGVLSIKDDKDILTVGDVSVSGSVDTTTAGVYNLTYSVTDSDNNTSSIIRTVAVGDSESLNIKHSLSEVFNMYSEEQLSSNEAIVCSLIHGYSNMYLGCNLRDTLVNALEKTYKGIVIVNKDINSSVMHAVDEGRDINLELNGKTISVTGDYTLKNMGNLLITDSVGTGTITNTDEKALYNLGKLVVNGGTYSSNSNCGICTKGGIAQINNATITSDSYSAIRNRSNSDLTLNNVVVTSSNDDAILNEVANITINGGTYTAQTAVIDNDSTGVININKGNFESKGDRTFVINGGVVNINGDEVTKDNQDNYISGTYIHSSIKAQLVYLNGGTLNVNGGTIESNYGDEVGCTALWNQTGTINIYNGNISSNRDIAIYSRSSTSNINIYDGQITSYKHTALYHQDGIVKISGGTLESKTGEAITNNAGTLYITNGTFIAKTAGVSSVVNGTSSGASSYICGGTFTTGSNNIRIVDSDAHIYYNNSATWNGSSTPVITGSASANCQLDNSITCN